MKTNPELKKLEARLTSGRRRNSLVWCRKTVFLVLRAGGLILTAALEWLAALGLFLTITLPVLILLTGRRIVTGQKIFRRRTIYGRDGEPRELAYFNLNYYLWQNADLFFYVLIGRLKLIGLSIKPYDPAGRTVGDSCLHDEKPGIFNLWFLRSSARIAHGGRLEVEKEYKYRHSLRADLLLVLKSIPALFFHVESRHYEPEIELMDIKFRNLTMTAAIDMIRELIAAGRRQRIFFVNADCFNQATVNSSYREVLQQEACIFPDGIGVNLACKIMHNPLRENINGTDMLPFLCRMAQQQGYSLYLLGGKPGIAERMRQVLAATYPGLRIAGCRHGYFDPDRESDAVVTAINAVAPTLLLVAFGVPRQELWITEHFNRLTCPIIIGVGGLFDFYSGNIRRAPQWMREVGLEWFFRLMMEPGRMFYRYVIGNPLFLWRFIRWKRQHFVSREL
ncbi:MAG: WecB/TagA/CpsF family glycosyltransferase [Victivallales bacterium]|nr:WecB/TagA/CpsF family glycosyltransferase [Victivallales bacterium]